MTEAGWYEDPEQHGRGRRYWDGAQWTEHYEFGAAAQQTPVLEQPQQPAQQLPPAGWKDDPEGGPGMRYWDGAQWTDHYHPPRDAAPAVQPAAQAYQPAPVQQPRQTSSLDETQIDVRGYHGGRPEQAASDPLAVADPAPSAAAGAAAASAAPSEADVAIDYGTAGEPATCDSCGAKIRSSHRFCPACGAKQSGTV